MGKWLRENGLDGITNQERYRALLCLENLEAIEVWRASPDDAQRRRLNHPGAIWAHWKRSTVSGETVSERTGRDGKSTKPHKGGYSRAIHWPSETLRRAASAICEARSNDCIVLAKAALAAAIRSENDLIELLEPKPPMPSIKATSSRELSPA